MIATATGIDVNMADWEDPDADDSPDSSTVTTVFWGAATNPGGPRGYDLGEVLYFMYSCLAIVSPLGPLESVTPLRDLSRESQDTKVADSVGRSKPFLES